MSEFFYSGEPLPLAPTLNEISEKDRQELEAFHRKLLDYLRRLGAKLSSERFAPPSSGAGTIKAFAGIISGAQAFTQSVFSAVDWDDFVWKDTGIFTHSTTTNPHLITVSKNGLYVICVDLERVLVGVPTADTNSLRLHVTGEGVYDHGHFDNYHAGISVVIPVHLDVGDSFWIESMSTSGTASIRELKEDGTRITVLCLAGDSSTDTGSGAGDLDPTRKYT